MIMKVFLTLLDKTARTLYLWSITRVDRSMENDRRTRPAGKCKCVLAVASNAIQARQIVECLSHIRMARTQGLLTDCQRALVESLRLAVPALRRINEA